MNVRASHSDHDATHADAALRMPGLERVLRFLRPSLDAAPSASTDWNRVLDRLAVPAASRSAILERSIRNGTSFRAELLVSGLVADDELSRAAAAELQIAVAEEISGDALAISDADCLALLGQRGSVDPPLLRRADGSTAIAIAPERIGFDRVAAAFSRRPHFRERFVAVSAPKLRAALMSRGRGRLLEGAVHGLANRFPDLSARIVASASQGFFVGVALVGLPVLTVLAPGYAFAAFHSVSSLFFLACVALRFAAMGDASVVKPKPLKRPTISELPTYSVLVALYREAEIVPELLVALSRLEWPRSKLEIKLVCEADDRETLAALKAHKLRAPVEIVEVPTGGPRTKPKALSYALPTVSGEFVVLYDAEDRPHPRQLLEAFQAFRAGPPDLACLQAPLDIANGGAGFIPRAFAFEYSALFKGMLPFLARAGVLLPLGGTSNHFRRAILEDVGAWDPYNVTEDADLGVRLARFGYRTGTITRPTLEDAPVTLPVWLRQRTRWFKGWGQTWFVHMREPRKLYRELGLGSFLVVQVLFLGMIVSSLVHPLLLVFLVSFLTRLALGAPLSTGQSLLLLVDVVNIVCGYVSFLLLGWQTMPPVARLGFWKVVAWTPVYWLMMSAAAWRAMWQLWRDPHLWEKTPHPRSSAGSLKI